MEKKMDHNEVIDRGINNIVSDRNYVMDYIAKHELWDTLTKSEQDFLNNISIACTELAETNTIRTPDGIQNKEELK